MSDVQKRILIVDDDDEIRELLEFDIASSGYFVDCAKDGLEGLNKALNNTYDIKQCIDKIRNIRQCIDKIRNKNEKLTINWITLKHHLYNFHYKFFSSTDVLNTEMSYVKVIIGRIFRCSILTGNEYTCDYYANNEHEYDKDYAKHVTNKES